MRRILLKFFAVIGFVVVGLIILAIGMATIQRSKKETLPEKMVLTMSLDGDLPETMSQNSMFDIVSGPHGMTLYETVQTLDRARQDQRVSGLVVRLDSNSIGLASMQELRSALLRFERSGKFAYAYIDDLGGASAMGEYWLASAFDQIWLHPVGSLALTGFSAELPFAKDMLDKVGIRAELLHQGKYKSFPESLTRNAISPENREMTDSMLVSIADEFYKDVGKSRKFSRQQIKAFIDRALIPAEIALTEGLVDSVGYRDEFDSYLEQKTQGTRPVSLEDYYSNGSRTTPGAQMALINVHGALTTVPADEAFSSNVASADLISTTIREASENAAIKAIIIRVDSPGGTPLAADIIRRSIQLATQAKPVVISMSNAAASGGYWMSAPANAIIAQPTTLTGSIGVFGGKMDASQLMKKIGVNFETVADNDNSDLWSVSKPYGDKSRAKIDAMMADTYRQFIKRVAEGRKLSPEQVEKVAQGRVWTGAQAVKNGLVDQLGGLDTAVNTAKALAKIPELKTVNLELFPKPLNKVEQFMKFVKQGVPTPLLASWLRQTFVAAIGQTFQAATLPVISQ